MRDEIHQLITAVDEQKGYYLHRPNVTRSLEDVSDDLWRALELNGLDRKHEAVELLVRAQSKFKALKVFHGSQVEDGFRAIIDRLQP